ncbi:alpha/beta fold hydrolase [Dictyobacter aurantiacus]|uniref:Putative hydrolase YugF n=1 Tax=Dictyobacter aurantiacus TaxID=1936993 RepID=A0A401ZEB5_9CHLR|nr:alpha/beta hydrolase [Dictyobacter aurantiacus]GCE05230.1 putative hydrolase YugF [Dictyobacter aurantiacus]
MASNTSGVLERRSGRSVHYNISYLVQGAEYGTDGAIVLLHDFPSGAFSWEGIMGQLGALRRAVYAFDMLGFGQSDHPWPADTSVWGQADVLSYLIKDLQLTNIVLVGHGLGGGVAQVLATRLLRPQTRALVLVNTNCYLHTFAENWPLTDMEKRRDFDAPHNTQLEDLINDLRETLPRGSANPQAFAKVISNYVDPWNNEIGKEILFQQVRNLIPYYLNSVSSDLRSLGKPTLIVWGERDEQIPLSYAERLHREIPQSQLVVLPNTGHLALFDAPDGVARALSDFVTNI